MEGFQNYLFNADCVSVESLVVPLSHHRSTIGEACVLQAARGRGPRGQLVLRATKHMGRELLESGV